MERCTMVAVGGALDDEAEAEVEADGDWVHDGNDSSVMSRDHDEGVKESL
jgi:hypothetical protein